MGKRAKFHLGRFFEGLPLRSHTPHMDSILMHRDSEEDVVRPNVRIHNISQVHLL